ncbi:MULTISPECIES: hypothetical protein [Aphanizomenon]|uniref:Uncharacterized protein n=1 Tax=Aphanizomenon flos-aquae FACHB-1249 TaxID=2692889 RepID=A0ABR8IPN4_APHFL|nr:MULTISPECIES: hypothetical protein [Aphanizomenon]MBD2632319.1 hypothetical protein [Aphanizomenon sp. FACHB-1399]MBD2643220.1 hypothetical protein [Aphanizomenon sp. FACHB-1401]MBD2684680.1 hypothetical protein [Aphanizomenon flos-aquae FACHB-1249]
MSFNNFAELQDLIRSYNSKSILEIGTRICWENFYIQQKSQQFDWFFYNAERNSAIRLMLLASMSNPHRKKNILEAEFNEFKYFFLNEKKLNHTIAYSNVLRQEAETISRCIKSWENNPKNIKKVSNWLLKPSDFFDVKVIDGETNYLFMQRQVAFRGEGFGNLKARILRTIKFIEFLESYSNREFGESYLKSNFLKSTGLSIDIYFRQFWGCLALFKRRDGYFDFSHFPGINQVIQEMGITIENLKLFIKQNSAPFHSESENSFRSKVSKKLQNTSEFYKPFFYNFFLEKPFVEFSKDQFYLPDPFSLIESCWNQIESSILENWPEKNEAIF